MRLNLSTWLVAALLLLSALVLASPARACDYSVPVRAQLGHVGSCYDQPAAVQGYAAPIVQQFVDPYAGVGHVVLRQRVAVVQPRVLFVRQPRVLFVRQRLGFGLRDRAFLNLRIGR